jgi:hypothetical protein
MVNKEGYHPYMPVDLDYSASCIRSSLRNIVEIILNNKEYCPNCGSILPELQIEYKDKVYSFTCFEVNNKKDEEEDTKMHISYFKKYILTTDYVKLKAYLDMKFKEK